MSYILIFSQPVISMWLRREIQWRERQLYYLIWGPEIMCGDKPWKILDLSNYKVILLWKVK